MQLGFIEEGKKRCLWNERPPFWIYRNSMWFKHAHSVNEMPTLNSLLHTQKTFAVFNEILHRSYLFFYETKTNYAFERPVKKSESIVLTGVRNHIWSINTIIFEKCWQLVKGKLLLYLPSANFMLFCEIDRSSKYI